MAAIQLEQLQSQLNELMWKFTQPEEFLAGLKTLLEYYGDRTFRLGSSSQSSRIIHNYRVPPIFLIQLNNALQLRCEENPRAAQSLADVLWNDSSFEIRRTAIEILASTPVDCSDEVSLRLKRWVQPGEDSELIWSLLETGGRRIREYRESDWLSLIEDWLENADDLSKSMGLKAALVTIRDVSFNDLPSLYTLLTPVLSHSPVSLQPDLIEIIKALAGRSPAEALFLIRQALILGDETNTTRLARKLLPEMDTLTGKKLRAILEETQRIRR